MVVDIQINTYKTKGSYDHVSFDIEVTEVNPWDPLSKAFKKYTHTIKYSSGHYVPSNYNISVYEKSSGMYKFRYNSPNHKVEKVELYFKADANINSMEPLILGFIYGRSNKSYYTYNHLKSNRVINFYLKRDGMFLENDLLTRLLEEIGNSISRAKKHVIRLGEKPQRTLTQSKYPDSGHYKDNKITVKKASDKGVLTGYDKYEHTIDFRDRIDDLYVSYKNNSRYFETGAGLGYYNLRSVNAYFETKTGKLVLFVLSFPGKKAYVYSYHDFVNDFQTLDHSKAKIITGLQTVGIGGIYSDSELESKLTEASNKLKQRTFVKDSRDGSDSRNNEHITTQQQDIEGGEGEKKFKKVTMTPDTTNGPWKVHNSQLFGREPSAKMQDDELLTGITKSKYQSITVFYNSNDKALLVEFDDYGDKTYFKRGDNKGTKWASADISIDIHGGSDLVPTLQRESERLVQLIEFRKGGLGDDGSNENKHISTSEPQNIGQGKGKETFIKVVMTPNTDDLGVRGVLGSSVGPWTVYNNNKLFSHEEGVKIPDSVLGGIFTANVTSSFSSKYSSITVYYSTKGGGSSSDSSSKHRALLVEFVKVGGGSTGDGLGTSSTNGIRGTNETKIYIRRTDYKGATWAIAPEIDSRITTDGARTAGAGSDRALLHVLQEESKRLRPMIEFVKGAGSDDDDDGNKNQNITTTRLQDVGQDTVGQGITFQKVTMTPNTGVDGSADGPWTVYNSQLITLETGMKIQGGVLSSIVTGDVISSGGSGNKYRSITVYYAMTGYDDYKALLVEFVKATSRIGAGGCGDRIYLRRENGEGSLWDGESGINTRDTKQLVEKLTRIGIDASIIKGYSSSSSTPGSSDAGSDDGDDEFGIEVGRDGGYIDGDDEVDGTGGLIYDVTVGSIEDEVVSDDEGDSNDNTTTDTLIKTGGGVAGGIGVVGGGLLLYKNFGSLVGLLKK